MTPRRRAWIAAAGWLTLALLAVAASWLLGGADGGTDSAAAVVLVGVPGLPSLALAARAADLRPETRAALMLGVGGLRMLLVLSAAVVLIKFSAVLGRRHLLFWAWLISFYVFTLVCEVAVAVASSGTGPASPPPDPDA